MKWLLITWYISGGYPWNSYEFDSKETCEAARETFTKAGVFADNYRWYCIKK